MRRGGSPSTSPSTRSSKEAAALSHGMAALREPSISVSRSPSQDGTHSIPLCERCPSCPAPCGAFFAQVRASRRGCDVRHTYPQQSPS